MPTLKDLREERAKIVKEMRDLIDTAEKEKRDLSADENQKHKDLFAKQEGLRSTIEMHERQAELDRQMADASYAARDARGAGDGDVEKRRDAAFNSFLTRGLGGLNDAERRDLTQTSNPDGGYLIAPMAFINKVIQKVDDAVFIRQKATVYKLPQASSMGAPSLDTDPSDADWTSELQTGSNDTAMKFGRRELAAKAVAKRVKVSKKLLQTGGAYVEQLVISRLAYKFGITHEKAFLTGNGSSQPLGVFAASNDGISTGRDVSNGNTTTAVTVDGLISAKYALKGQYHRNAAWMFHRNGVEMISKLKNSQGDYLWRESVKEGEPDRILNFPIMMSEYVPNTFTTGQYVGIVGDFSQYWILDALDFQVQRLTELYAESNSMGYIGRWESDGMPVLEEAFARVKLA